MTRGKNSYERAKARVKSIKSFYNHLLIYIIFLVLWIIFAGKFFGLLENSIGNGNEGFLRWANVNFWLNPLIWGVVVLIHGIFVFGLKSSIFRNWEERKIQEFMNEDVTEKRNRYE